MRKHYYDKHTTYTKLSLFGEIRSITATSTFTKLSLNLKIDYKSR